MAARGDTEQLRAPSSDAPTAVPASAVSPNVRELAASASLASSSASSSEGEDEFDLWDDEDDEGESRMLRSSSWGGSSAGSWASSVNDTIRSPPTAVTPIPAPSPSPLSTQTPTLTPTVAITSDSGSSVGVIAGVVVALVVVVVAAVFFVKRRKKNGSKETVGAEANAYVDMEAPPDSKPPAQPKRLEPSTQQSTKTAETTSTLARTVTTGTSSRSTTSTTTGSTSTQQDDFPNQLLLTVRIPLEELEMGDVISQGGFGEVLFGKYRNQDVAIKRLLASRRRDRKSVASFIQEIELNASLDHECLVRFIGVAWEVRENLCMVSEFMHGGDLRTLLAGYAQSGHPNGHDGGKLRTAVQVAQALAYLHGLDPPVVHRDLKSRNILLTELLDAKLIDFGVSTECQDETMTAGVGTSLWMAPEIMLGKRYDEKSDIFSFGVILSELDTHEIPYDHARDPGSNRKLSSIVLNRLIYEGRLKPRFTEMANPEIVALAKECLELDPSLRPTSSELLDRIRRSRQHGGRAPTEGSGFMQETTEQNPRSPFDTRTRMPTMDF